ncbi:competence protein ComEC [Evansella caseinilytica]|uniref:Competence protein ComEC n=1 Tax=Evansella caseinilytica TaxID=1503961 RepID=A0A1H3KFI8_9BACI|nr:DNA internalization-related competence protein ComEC/Rec2 [Evansella caseinilytica]SDY50903.1 competence protein ComEC [Evansella caseinilytica]
MFSRSYCSSLAAVSGLLFSQQGFSAYALFFLTAALLPLILSAVRRHKSIRQLRQLIIVFICFFVFIGVGKYVFTKTESSLTGEETNFSGIISSEPALTSSNQWSFQVDLLDSERVQLFLDVDDNVPAYRDDCEFSGKLSLPGTATNPFAFDYQNYLNQQGVHWIIHSSQPMQCKGQRSTFLAVLKNIRRHGINNLQAAGNLETAAMISALVFGERSAVPEARIASYRQLGIIHLLAVSGLHVGMVSFAFFYLLCRFGFTKEKACIALLIFLPVYAVLAGGSPSVLRASLMTFAVAICTIFNWKIRAIDLLSLLFLLFLLVNPYLLFHLGFQLSFLTSFALLVSQRLFLRRNRIVVLMQVTIIAQLVSLPLILFHYYEMSFLSLPINMLFIPFISAWILPVSFLTVLFGYFLSPLASVGFFLVDISLRFAHGFLDFIAGGSWHVIVFGRPSTTVVLLLFATVFLIFICYESQKRLPCLLSTAFLLAVLLYQSFHPYFRSYAVLTMLDVGQGDAAVLELPYRRGVYVIDTGGNVRWGETQGDAVTDTNGPGKRVIEPFLKGNGIKTIDRLILSHGHLDHMGEACYLVKTFQVKQIYYPKEEDVAEEALPILRCIAENGGNIVQVREGMRWMVENDQFYILSPTGTEANENDRSIVLLSIVEQATLLFTGDIEAESEKRLVQAYHPANTDILKVAHHGSKTSTGAAFIEHFSPKLALISAGRNNRFGHPHPDVVDRLNDVGIPIFRTDIHGAVQIKIESGNIKVVHYINVEEEQ